MAIDSDDVYKNDQPLQKARENARHILKQAVDEDDFERAHSDADGAVIELLEAYGEQEIVTLWHGVGKWYA